MKYFKIIQKTEESWYDSLKITSYLKEIYK